MTDFFDAWDAKKAPRDPTGPVEPVNVSGGTSYGAAALAGEVANLLAVPVGAGRNDQLNRSAVKMYGLAAAGHLDERAVTETLGAADGGLDYPATRRTLQSAREAVYGRLGARRVDLHTTATQRRELAPWEQSDDPLADNFVEPHVASSVTTGGPSGSGTAERGSPNTAASAGVAGGTSSTEPNTTSTAPADAGQAAYDAAVAIEAYRLRLQRDARRRVDHEDAAKLFRVPEYLPTLTDELLIPDEPVTYRVDRLIPTGGNVLLAAQFKAGKTTLINNLARALADHEAFLGRYDVDALTGRVAIFNYEVDRAQYRRWLRDVGITNTDRVAVLPLRGFRLPLLVPHVEDWVVDYLQRAEAEVWIVDPFARAASGSIQSENDNTEVGTFLEALDVIKERAGVSELILPTHTGRAEHEQGDERARGATRLDDWADVRWMLTRDKADARYFRATGRDVDEDESALAFDETTRQLTITGGDRRTVARNAARDAVVEVVTNRPGIGVTELRRGVRQILGTCSTERIDSAVDGLLYDRAIHTEKNGHANGHYLGAGAAVRGPDVDPLG